MDNMVMYFIKSGIAMFLFYGVYRLFMEKETHYSLNRFYLAGTILLSLVLPVLPLERLFSPGGLEGMPVLVISGGSRGLTASVPEAGSLRNEGRSFGAYELARILYLIGAVVLMATLIIQLIRLMLMKAVSRERYGRMRILFFNRDIAPFSILNRVFVSQEIRSDPQFRTILDHESAHYRLLHFIDLVVLEFIAVFQWFNPLAWMYIRSLREIHEYQADAAVLRKGGGTGAYKALLVNQLTGTEVFRLANGFSKSLTKKRMIMMTRMKSGKGAWLKVLFAMPVMALLLIAYAANSPVPPVEDGDYLVKGKVLEAGSGDPLPGVNVIWQGTNTGTYTDRDGKFSLHVSDRNAVVVYSFVGFETVKTKGAGDFTIKMEQKAYMIPLAEKEVPNLDPGKKPSREQAMKEKQMQEKRKMEGKAGEGGEPVYIVEDMPEFQGKGYEACREYIQEHVVYPAEARKAGIKGLVYVQFVVGAKGQVRNAIVKRGVDPLLDRAALDAVKAMPDWEPGRQRGKNVAVIMIVPVRFGGDMN